MDFDSIPILAQYSQLEGECESSIRFVRCGDAISSVSHRTV